MKRVQVLDHGYVEIVEHWGSDERIIEAARMSTQKGFEGWGPTCAECGFSKGDDHEVGCSRPDATKPGDEKLLAYLWKNNHATPFEMAGAIIEVQAPIFVFREWHRHRTQSYNEMSARYVPLPAVDYLPTVERLMLNSKVNKQAGTVAGAEELTAENAVLARDIIAESYIGAQTDYEVMLKRGVPKELARLVLPVGRYSKMRASANLRNWLAFLTLREDPKAQWEIRQYAIEVSAFLSGLFPRTMALFHEGRK